MPAKWRGKCSGVKDGDTIRVMLQGRPQFIQLYGIDCPEKAQAYGGRAQRFTASLALGKSVTVFSKGKDRYGRVHAWVFADSHCINAELVSNGLAWWLRQNAPNEIKLGQLEKQAQDSRRGLWAAPERVAPWQYREHGWGRGNIGIPSGDIAP